MRIGLDETMSMNRRHAIQLIAATVPVAAATPSAFSFAEQSNALALPAFAAIKFVFDGVYSELRIPIKESDSILRLTCLPIPIW